MTHEEIAALLERLDNGPYHVGRASGQIIEIKQAATAIRQLMAENERLAVEADRAWTERNIAYAKVKAWESVVYVEGLPRLMRNLSISFGASSSARWSLANSPKWRER